MDLKGRWVEGVLGLPEDPSLCSPRLLLHSSSLPHPREPIRNCALSMDQIPDLHSPMTPISESPSSPAYSTGKPREGNGASGGAGPGCLCKHPMCFGCLLPSSENNSPAGTGLANLLREPLCALKSDPHLLIL